MVEGEPENQKKSKQQSNKTDLQKQANLQNEIFDYIHNALYRRLFLLVWYDDMTNKVDDNSLSKTLPTLYCNRSSCQSAKPDILQREPFIDNIPIKYTEIDQEWIAYQTATLKT